MIFSSEKLLINSLALELRLLNLTEFCKSSEGQLPILFSYYCHAAVSMNYSVVFCIHCVVVVAIFFFHHLLYSIFVFFSPYNRNDVFVYLSWFYFMHFTLVRCQMKLINSCVMQSIGEKYLKLIHTSLSLL